MAARDFTAFLIGGRNLPQVDTGRGPGPCNAYCAIMMLHPSDPVPDEGLVSSNVKGTPTSAVNQNCNPLFNSEIVLRKRTSSIPLVFFSSSDCSNAKAHHLQNSNFSLPLAACDVFQCPARVLQAQWARRGMHTDKPTSTYRSCICTPALCRVQFFCTFRGARVFTGISVLLSLFLLGLFQISRFREASLLCLFKFAVCLDGLSRSNDAILRLCLS